MSDVTPRRCRVDLYVPAETAIRAAILAVEEMPADERLTAAVILLGQAQNKVADFIDGVGASPEGPTAPAATNEPIYVGTRADWKWRAEQAEAALSEANADLARLRHLAHQLEELVERLAEVDHCECLHDTDDCCAKVGVACANCGLAALTEGDDQ